MSSFSGRLTAEKDRIVSDHAKLCAFFESGKVESLSKANRDLLSMQADVMSELITILNIRIELNS